MTIGNLDQVLAQYRRIFQAVEQGIAEGLRAEAERVLAESQRRVPRLTDELFNSAFITAPEVSGGRAEITIGYAAEHAAIVHEDLNARHDDGEAKFLERAVDATTPGRAERIGRAVTTAMRRVLR